MFIAWGMITVLFLVFCGSKLFENKNVGKVKETNGMGLCSVT